jgi:hypothetical protein
MHSIISQLYKKVNGYLQARLYIGSKRAAVVYGGLAYLGHGNTSEILHREKNSPEKFSPEDEC